MSDKKFVYVSTFELADSELNDIQVMRAGKFSHPAYGKFEITEGVIDEVIQNKGVNDIVVDYEHNSGKGDPEKAKAAGWVKGLYKKAGELWAQVAWTPQAREYIGNSEFKYFSPEFTLDASDKETGDPIGARLLAVGLTNRAFLDGMQPALLSEQFAVLAEDAPEEKTEIPETKEVDTMSDDLIKKLAEAVGLEDVENATEDQVTQSFTALSDRNLEIDKEIVRLKMELEEQQAQSVKEGEVIVKEEDVKTLNDQIVELQEQVKPGLDAMKELNDMRRDKAVGDAIALGKLAPAAKDVAEKLYEKDPALFSEFIEKSPTIIATTPIGGETPADTGEDAEAKLLNEAKALAEDKGISLNDAFNKVKQSNPDLVKEYEADKRKKRRSAKG